MIHWRQKKPDEIGVLTGEDIRVPESRKNGFRAKFEYPWSLMVCGNGMRCGKRATGNSTTRQQLRRDLISRVCDLDI